VSLNIPAAFKYLNAEQSKYVMKMPVTSKMMTPKKSITMSFYQT